MGAKGRREKGVGSGRSRQSQRGRALLAARWEANMQRWAPSFSAELWAISAAGISGPARRRLKAVVVFGFGCRDRQTDRHTKEKLRLAARGGWARLGCGGGWRMEDGGWRVEGGGGIFGLEMGG